MKNSLIKGQEAVGRAQTLATEAGNPQIEALHLLAGLMQESEGIVHPLLEKIGVDLRQVESTVESEVERLPKVSGGASPPMGQSLRAGACRGAKLKPIE